MPLITADDFFERFDIDDTIDAARIDPHIGSASRRLRKWVGEDTYGSSDDDVVSDLKNAEAHLTYHFAIFGMNAPLSKKGVVATAMSAEGREMRKYLSPKETAELSGYFLELAREIVEPYLLADGTPSASFEVIAEEEFTEASTRSNAGNCC
jgi:hypothetical protein